MLNIKLSLILFLIIIITVTIIIIICLNKKSKFLEIKIPKDDNFYFEIENVLTDKECDYVINNTKDKLLESTVMSLDKNGNYLDKKNTSRTSNHAFIDNNLHKNIIEKAEKLINKYSSLPVNRKQFEQIQVVRYKPGQEYKEHFDICHPYQAYEDQLKTCKKEFKRYNSVRYATIIFYLNDGFNGGETYFPNLNKKIIPKKGKVLLFFNCTYNKNTYKNGLCDVIKNSLHAGLPVIEGKVDEKWIANIWIRLKNT